MIGLEAFVEAVCSQFEAFRLIRGVYRASERQVNIGPVTLANHLLVLVVDGAFKVTLPDREFVLKAGQVMWLPPGIHRGMTSLDEISVTENIRIHFDCPVPITACQVFYASNEAIKAAKNLAAFPENESKSRFFAQFLYFVSQLDAEEPRANRFSSSLRWRQLLAFIQDNLKLDLSVEVLAKQVELTPDYFSRAFKETFGEPPARFVRQLRLNQATHLLSDTLLPIHEIAEECGWVDTVLFNRQFKAAFGTTPRAFRKSGRLPN